MIVNRGLGVSAATSLDGGGDPHLCELASVLGQSLRMGGEGAIGGGHGHLARQFIPPEAAQGTDFGPARQQIEDAVHAGRIGGHEQHALAAANRRRDCRGRDAFLAQAGSALNECDIRRPQGQGNRRPLGRVEIAGRVIVEIGIGERKQIVETIAVKKSVEQMGRRGGRRRGHPIGENDTGDCVRKQASPLVRRQAIVQVVPRNGGPIPRMRGRVNGWIPARGSPARGWPFPLAHRHSSGRATTRRGRGNPLADSTALIMQCRAQLRQKNVQSHRILTHEQMSRRSAFNLRVGPSNRVTVRRTPVS